MKILNENEQHIIVTKGLPGSGKSYWAEALVRKDSRYRQVNRDCIREMLFGTRWTGGINKDEVLVSKIQQNNVLILLTGGYNVIVSDTNLRPRNYKWVYEFGVPIYIKDLTGVSLETCILRDKARGSIVGEAVITDLYNKYIDKKA